MSNKTEVKTLSVERIVITEEDIRNEYGQEMVDALEKHVDDVLLDKFMKMAEEHEEKVRQRKADIKRDKAKLKEMREKQKLMHRQGRRS